MTNVQSEWLEKYLQQYHEFGLWKKAKIEKLAFIGKSNNFYVSTAFVASPTRPSIAV
jgi:hypothetical protein